jgi:hypothetical protein
MAGLPPNSKYSMAELAACPITQAEKNQRYTHAEEALLQGLYNSGEYRKNGGKSESTRWDALAVRYNELARRLVLEKGENLYLRDGDQLKRRRKTFVEANKR